MSTSPAVRVTGSDLAWAVFSAAMLLQMWLTPDDLTTPYHLMWVATILLYGFRLWPPRQFFPVLGVLTVLTGLLFLRPFLAGHISWDEMSEVPLMPLIVGLGAWHAWRRSQAQRRVEVLAALESSRLDRQREFLRDASHAIRTPVTIARGHVELLARQTDDEDVAADTAEVLHQLDRLTHLAGRLLVIEQLATTEALDAQLLDPGQFLEKIGRRWSTAVPRSWVVDTAPAGTLLADVRRLEEAVDALVENALRFTGPQDVIRLSTRTEPGFAVIEVADSGPGIPPEDRTRVFDRFFHRHPRGEEPGTGLGLALVQAVAVAHLGAASAGSAPEGGALLTLRLPLHLPAPARHEIRAPLSPVLTPHPDPT
ncbi:MAG TPA: HAMP domain-containing sensor histidine kinase [Kineosporiaceae bacterium]|nr:HAMP domain-containing sensor histidine kinase [Kineosporiaceae bacterium]